MGLPDGPAPPPSTSNPAASLPWAPWLQRQTAPASTPEARTQHPRSRRGGGGGGTSIASLKHATHPSSCPQLNQMGKEDTATGTDLVSVPRCGSRKHRAVLSICGRPGGPAQTARQRGGRQGVPQGCPLTTVFSSAAMSYPVTSQPQCASSCYQTQLSDWHTGLTDCCNDMPVCECGRGPRTPSPSDTISPWGPELNTFLRPSTDLQVPAHFQTLSPTSSLPLLPLPARP